jgi:antitoxin (DNA-binding transcriptional repressor) of toxin-antitoxin stability system
MPDVYNMHAAKTQLSKLAERAAGGEEILIARNGHPVAKLGPLETPRKPIRFGLAAGRIRVRDDFDEPLPSEIMIAFEGNGA